MDETLYRQEIVWEDDDDAGMSQAEVGDHVVLDAFLNGSWIIHIGQQHEEEGEVPVREARLLTGEQVWARAKGDAEACLRGLCGMVDARRGAAAAELTPAEQASEAANRG